MPISPFWLLNSQMQMLSSYRHHMYTDVNLHCNQKTSLSTQYSFADKFEVEDGFVKSLSKDFDDDART
jgi:hypothetical protein